MKTVTKERFYEVVGPLDVSPDPGPDETIWRDQKSHAVVGKTQGYKNTSDVAEPFYMLREDLA